MFDGAWWPQSRNPASELPGLVLAIDSLRGKVLRLILAATGWDERPRRVIVGGRAITIDYFGSQPATLITAVCGSSRVDLLVIPPTAGPQAAHAAMANAMSAGNRVVVPRPSMSYRTDGAAQQAEVGAPQRAAAALAVAADSPRLGW